MTLAGSMTVAKQSLIIAELIDRGIVNAIVSTGALMAHGLVEATDARTSATTPTCRIPNSTSRATTGFMTRSSRSRIWTTSEEVMSEILEGWDHNEVMCSYKLNHAIGQYLTSMLKTSAGS